MVKAGDRIYFRMERGVLKHYTRPVKEVVPGGVIVVFFHRGMFVPKEYYTTTRPAGKKRHAIKFYYYIVDINTGARVSYINHRETPMWQLLARLTKQYPARDFGFRSARRRPVGDTVDRLDTETLHLD